LNHEHLLFELDSSGIEARLQRKPSLIEVFSVAFPIGLTLLFAYLNSSANMPFAPDFDTYLHAARGNLAGFYYAYWSLPIFQGLLLLPGAHTAYILWCIVNVLGVWFAVRVFGGKSLPVLLSYQMLFVCFYGQIAGITVAALALLWWSLERRRWLLAGIGLMLVLIKWQTGFPLGLALLLLAETSWYVRLLTILVALIGMLLSLLIYPNWPLEMITRLSVDPPIRFGDISLWPHFGALVLLLWIPTLLLPMQRGRRYAAICATTALAIPYFQQTGLLTLFVLPIGWFALLGNLTYIYFWFRNTQLEFVTLVPLLGYIWILWSPLRKLIAQRFVSFHSVTG
jgi:hypothetical protein